MPETARRPFSKSVVGQSLCSAGAGIFQVYSGGIAIDTVSTRMQAGAGLRAAFLGSPTAQISLINLLHPRNLYSGHAVMALGRFPYLFTSLNTYATIERALASTRTPPGGRKSRSSEAACIGGACLTSSAVITTIECPKVMAQLNQTPGTPSPTFYGILREHGIGRLLRGYDATVLRESFFSCALLGSPFISRELRRSVVEPILQSAEQGRVSYSVYAQRAAAMVDGREMLATSFFMGLLVGFVTNGPDQLKTRIQFGQFMNLPEAFAWQMREGGGVRALYGRAAIFRAFYTGHGVLALNFMRHKVEHVVDWLVGRYS